jgi:starvation-inducible DNA-binding protein
MNGILADVFALYLKTKNFHWHLSGQRFRDYHFMLDGTLTDAVGRVGPLRCSISARSSTAA